MESQDTTKGNVVKATPRDIADTAAWIAGLIHREQLARRLFVQTYTMDNEIVLVSTDVTGNVTRVRLSVSDASE